jgi:hypothetical protein
MGYQIIKQPSGLLALFSSYNDSWVAWDLTSQDVRDWFAEKAAEGRPVNMEQVDRYIGLVLADQAEKAYSRTWVLTFAEAQAHSWHHGGEVLAGPVAENLLVELERPLDDADVG